MTAQPVNLENFREAIDHDKELEQELFEEFIRSSEVQLEILGQHITSQNDNTLWKHAAHALKSTSGSLGAMPLSDLCARAQAEYNADFTQKGELYNMLQHEYQRVKKFIKSA